MNEKKTTTPMAHAEERSELLARFEAARQRKRDHIAKVAQSLCEDYRKRTGVEPKYINVW